MNSEFVKHLPHYLSLLGILVLGFWGFVNFPYDKAFQTAIAVSVGTSFVAWGVIHHHVHEDLRPKIILEYLAMAVLGSVVLLGLIWNG